MKSPLQALIQMGVVPTVTFLDPKNTMNDSFGVSVASIGSDVDESPAGVTALVTLEPVYGSSSLTPSIR